MSNRSRNNADVSKNSTFSIVASPLGYSERVARRCWDWIPDLPSPPTYGSSPITAALAARAHTVIHHNRLALCCQANSGLDNRLFFPNLPKLFFLAERWENRWESAVLNHEAVCGTPQRPNTWFDCIFFFIFILLFQVSLLTPFSQSLLTQISLEVGKSGLRSFKHKRNGNSISFALSNTLQPAGQWAFLLFSCVHLPVCVCPHMRINLFLQLHIETHQEWNWECSDFCHCSTSRLRLTSDWCSCVNN